MSATVVGSAVDRWFVKEVAERTDGEVNVEIF